MQVAFYVKDIYGLSESSMDYTVSLYFRQIWTDPRLKVYTAS